MLYVSVKAMEIILEGVNSVDFTTVTCIRLEVLMAVVLWVVTMFALTRPPVDITEVSIVDIWFSKFCVFDGGKNIIQRAS